MVFDPSLPGLPPLRREGDTTLFGPVVVKDTILQDVCVNNVSMPSFAGGPLGRGRLAVFAGSVKERRMLGLDAAAAGACSGVVDAIGEDMAMASLDHFRRKDVELRIAYMRAGESAG